jgi:hypothetical protein
MFSTTLQFFHVAISPSGSSFYFPCFYQYILKFHRKLFVLRYSPSNCVLASGGLKKAFQVQSLTESIVFFYSAPSSIYILWCFQGHVCVGLWNETDTVVAELSNGLDFVLVPYNLLLITYFRKTILMLSSHLLGFPSEHFVTNCPIRILYTFIISLS